MSNLFDEKNQDSSFIRKVIVGSLSFLYDMLEIKTIGKKGEQMVKVPIFYTMLGQSQFVLDFFGKDDKYCKELKPLATNTNKIPSGILRLDSISYSEDDILADHNMVRYAVNRETQFGSENVDMVSYAKWIPMNLKCYVEIKCETDLDRFKIIECIMKKLQPSKEFRIRFEGMILPVIMEIADDVDGERNIKVKFPDGQERPTLSFNVSILAWMVDIDKTTETYAGEKINKFIIQNLPNK